MKRHAVAAIVGMLIWLVQAPLAHACGPVVEIRFYESDGDVFIIENNSLEPWSLVSLDIILTGSTGRLVFDTVEGGPGYNSPQQFEAVDNDVGLAGTPVVADGAEALSLSFLNFKPKRSFIFVIDLDDRVENSDFGQAVISGTEIQGARARALLINPKAGKTHAEGTFGTDGKARLRGATCA